MDLKHCLRSESGQSTLEYILVLILVIAVFSAIGRVFQAAGVVDLMMAPIKKEYKAVYKYGHVKAEGPDEGSSTYHPDGLYGSPSRLFINPNR